jgi:hypothetical protein
MSVAAATAAIMATPVAGLRIADAAPKATAAPNASTRRRSPFVSWTRPRTFRRKYDQLMSERSVLCLKSALRLERRGAQGLEEAEQSDYRR